MPFELDARGFGRHTFLCGQSGSGKTYSLGVLLFELLTGQRPYTLGARGAVGLEDAALQAYVPTVSSRVLDRASRRAVGPRRGRR